MPNCKCDCIYRMKLYIRYSLKSHQPWTGEWSTTEGSTFYPQIFYYNSSYMTLF